MSNGETEWGVKLADRSSNTREETNDNWRIFYCLGRLAKMSVWKTLRPCACGCGVEFQPTKKHQYQKFASAKCRQRELKQRDEGDLMYISRELTVGEIVLMQKNGISREEIVRRIRERQSEYLAEYRRKKREQKRIARLNIERQREYQRDWARKQREQKRIHNDIAILKSFIKENVHEDKNSE